MPLRIRTRINYTGCKAPPPPIVIKERRYRESRPMNRGVPWSDEEKKMLRDLIKRGVQVKFAASNFPARTHSAVAHMASVMGLVKSGRGKGKK